MKKITITLITLYIIIFITLSCKKNKQVEVQEYSQKLGLYNSDKKITTLSNLTRVLGITSLDRQSIDYNSVEYKFTGGQRKINNYSINLNEAVFTYSLDKNGTINIKLNNKDKIVSLSINSIKKTIFYKEKNILLSESNSKVELTEVDNSDISIAVSLLLELTDPEIKRLSPLGKSNDKNIVTHSTTCEYALSSWYTTKSRSESAIASHTQSYLKSHPDCHTIYGVDTGCLWGDFGCVSVQAVECHGASCN